MNLRNILDSCQEDHLEDWVLLPGDDPARFMLAGFVDESSTDQPAAVTALLHDHRAVYVPDPTIGIAWGMDDHDRPLTKHEPDWQPEEWNSVSSAYAHVLLNGTMVWQVMYASVNWGAGISGYLPWPDTKYAANDNPLQRSEVVGWRTTSWEASFTRLLTKLSGNTEFPSEAEEVSAGMLVEMGHPLDG